jgi:hypothetical protein
VIPSHARKRLFLESPLDGSARPLTEKLLERGRMIRRLRDLILDPERAHLVPYNTTEIERDSPFRTQRSAARPSACSSRFAWPARRGCSSALANDGLRSTD